jgi:hypothetical protein
MCHHRLLATLRLRRWQIWRRSASCVPTAARGADGDVEVLPLMLGLAEEIDAAIAETVKGLRPAPAKR